MNIAVNTRLLTNDIHGGIEWFTYESLSRITKNNPEHRFFFLFDRPFNDKYIFASNIQPLVIGPPAVHPLLWYTWFEWRIPPVLRKIKADLFLSTEGMIPLKAKVPCLTVIHDLNFHHRPLDLPKLQAMYYRRFFGKFALNSSRIATVSEFSKEDITKTLKIDPKKIDVVYNGAAEEFYPVEEPLHNKIRSEISGGDPYFLFVGNLSPRKNVPNLINAFNEFRANHPDRYKLVIVGQRFFLNGELDKTYNSSPFKKDIVFPGPKTRDELRELYSAAEALVFVPWFEGFGLPVIEAMKCGTPVISSNITSLPEIGGEAAIYVDPGDPKGIAKAMLGLSRDGVQRKELITRGHLQAEKFTWDHTANSLWSSVIKTIKLK
jgi:glycosyltransferase involved in cell wall biosynthesis